MVPPEPRGCVDVNLVRLLLSQKAPRGVTVGSLLGRAMGCQCA